MLLLYLETIVLFLQEVDVIYGESNKVINLMKEVLKNDQLNRISSRI